MYTASSKSQNSIQLYPPKPRDWSKSQQSMMKTIRIKKIVVRQPISQLKYLQLPSFFFWKGKLEQIVGIQRIQEVSIQKRIKMKYKNLGKQVWVALYNNELDWDLDFFFSTPFFL